MVGEECARLGDEIVEGENAVHPLAFPERRSERHQELRQTAGRRERREEAVFLGEHAAESWAVVCEVVTDRARQTGRTEEPAEILETARLEDGRRRAAPTDLFQHRLVGRPRCAKAGDGRRVARRAERRAQPGGDALRRLPEGGRGDRGQRLLMLHRGGEPDSVPPRPPERREQPDADSYCSSLAAASQSVALHELAPGGVPAPHASDQLLLDRGLHVGLALVLVEDRGARIDPCLERVLA